MKSKSLLVFIALLSMALIYVVFIRDKDGDEAVPAATKQTALTQTSNEKQENSTGAPHGMPAYLKRRISQGQSTQQ